MVGWWAKIARPMNQTRTQPGIFGCCGVIPDSPPKLDLPDELSVASDWTSDSVTNLGSLWSAAERAKDSGMH
jgi:hypothetical protein